MAAGRIAEALRLAEDARATGREIDAARMTSGLVRCRECRRSKEDGARLLCDHPRCVGFLVAEPDGFCAWASRRNDDGR